MPDSWNLWAGGYTLVSANPNSTDVDFNASGKTGGEKTHTLSIDEMPQHQHDLPDQTVYGAEFEDAYNHGDTTHVYELTEDRIRNLMSGVAGGGLAHNNMQPYMTVYIWRRIK